MSKRIFFASGKACVAIDRDAARIGLKLPKDSKATIWDLTDALAVLVTAYPAPDMGGGRRGA